MDSLTQATFGALCGDLVLGRRLGNKALLWGTLVGTLPDLDVLSAPFMDQLDELAIHRGISHSIVMMIFLSPVIGWIIQRFHRNADLSFAATTGFAFLGLSTHVLIDCFTTYGTQVLQPFSNTRIAFNNFFIIDLFFLLPMLIGLIIGAFQARDSPSRRLSLWAISLWLVTYTSMSFIIKARANEVFRDQLAAQGLQVVKFQSAPTLTNIALWRGIADVGDEFLIGYWSIFDDNDEVRFDRVPKHRFLAKPWHDTRVLDTLAWFSKDYWTATLDPNGNVVIADLRFGELRSFDDSGNATTTPIFRWALAAPDETNPDAMMRSARPKGTNMKRSIRAIFRRAGGDETAW